jgi:curved DNA-binding protein
MDYYSILGVPRTATPEEIRKAYKKQSMRHHPDRGGKQEDFVKVQQAYEVLSNSDKRDAYDNPQPGFSFNSQDFASGYNPFADIFRNHQQRTPRNRDITVQAKIEMSEVITGKNLIIQYRLSSGRLETVTVDVPPGAKHGDTIQYEGLGDEGNRHYPRGNLLVRIVVSKAKGWERDGDNLITKKSVNVFDFLTGCAIIIQTLDNKQLELKIPKGTNIGTKFSIPGYGLPNINTGRRGNLYITVNAFIPKIEDEETLNKLRDIKKEL